MHVDGHWPDTVALRKGWGRATARPWNPLTKAGALRLLRGNSTFLGEATEWTVSAAGTHALSPALYPSGARIWERSGYQELLRLEIMEKSIDSPRDPEGLVEPASNPDLAEIEALDRLAFDAFWHMGAAGLSEAIAATPRSAVLEVRHGSGLAGYAIVGAQLGVAFLQRIAVDPTLGRQGLGGALVRAAERWSAGRGATIMVLNVRPDNDRARQLYLTSGFRATGKDLLVLSYPTDSLI